MKIKRNGFVCGIAYMFTNDSKIPERTNLCSLFWRFILNIIPFSVIFIILGGIALVFYLLSFLFGFLFAKRPGKIQTVNGNYEWGTVEYKKWPTVRGRKIYPIWILVLVLLWWARDFIFGFSFSLGGHFVSFISSRIFLDGLLILFLSILGLILLTAFFLGIRKMLESETCQLFIGMLEAQKQKVCPIVEIVKADKSIAESDS